MNLTSLMLGAVAALGFVASVHAHHGWGAYDTDWPLYLEGTVTGSPLAQPSFGWHPITSL